MSTTQETLASGQVGELFLISDVDKTERLGYDPVFKISMVDNLITRKTVEENKDVGWVVMAKRDASYAWSVSWSDTKETAIARFLNWCRMRRGCKTWEAWQSSGYYVTKIRISVDGL